MYERFIMLIHLRLKNIALIEIIEINFEKGLNIFTGDSGSGKSLILDSLNVLFGGTNIPIKHLIRPGKDDCLIEAKFAVSSIVKDWLFKNGFKIKSNEIFLSRHSYKKCQKIISKFMVNNESISKKLLGELGVFLVDFAGQSDSFLFDSLDYRRKIIDDLGSEELITVNNDIKNYWEEFEMLQKRRIEKFQVFKNKEENNFALKKMFNILQKANLDDDQEITKLKAKEFILSNNFEIKNAIQLSLNNLNHTKNDVPSVSSLIAESIKHLNKIVQFDIKVEVLRDNLVNIQNDLENLHFDLNKYLDAVGNEDSILEEVQNRLFYLQNLERTFSLELPELIQKREELRTFVDNTNDEEIKNLDFQINNLRIILEDLFQTQSSLRRETANQLQESVSKILKNLGLENSTFIIDFNKVKPSAEGVDNINFLFSANPDQNLAPLSKVISGGEMSRFLLAIKSCISKKSETFFLDELDNGLSGKSLLSLVELIKIIGKKRQVLCITHQPFLAANATVHYKVKKNVVNGMTFTSVAKLSSKTERQNELIELIGGGFSDAKNYASSLLERTAA